MTSAHADKGSELTRVERDALRLCAVSRTSGDMSFLSGDDALTTRALDDCLAALEDNGLVRRQASPRGPLWSRTAAGDVALRATEDWQLVVDETFPLSHRPRPLVIGSVVRGVVYGDDWFRVEGPETEHGIGRILTIEFGLRGRTSAESVTLTADVDLDVGDVLTRFEPMA